jgi:hypothetical protein
MHHSHDAGLLEERVWSELRVSFPSRTRVCVCVCVCVWVCVCVASFVREASRILICGRGMAGTH